jgi:uncharacterized repeat protein (TIGR03803 family)
MKQLNCNFIRNKKACALFAMSAVFSAMTVVGAPAQTFQARSFDGADGSYSWAQLIQTSNGNFYGTTQNGGSGTCPAGCGTIFEVTPTGKETVFSFDGTNGSGPFGGLIQGSDGNFYGQTSHGGNATCLNGCGTVFKITPAGQLTTLHNFDYTDGADGTGALVQATDGNLYGTTELGGAFGSGVIFKITTSGTFSVFYTFTGGADGAAPVAGMIQATDGNLYGTTWGYGYNNLNQGTVFKISLTGTLTTLHSFQLTDGALPFAPVYQAKDGNFYGTTEEGGTFNYGTVFSMTPSGAVTTLHSFAGGTDGDTPISPLIEATDGNFYGTASYDGKYPNFGTVYRITASGTLTTIHNFNSTEGSYPYGGLIQAKNRVLYGVTFAGGSSTACHFGCGVLYSLTAGK